MNDRESMREPIFPTAESSEETGILIRFLMPMVWIAALLLARQDLPMVTELYRWLPIARTIIIIVIVLFIIIPISRNIIWLVCYFRQRCFTRYIQPKSHATTRGMAACIIIPFLIIGVTYLPSRAVKPLPLGSGYKAQNLAKYK